jgi:dipeptidyl aminopeptidase/acylaminoacyl peptidase
VRQITNTVGCEYEPNWSPDGKRIAYTATKRDVTTIDSVAEDRHVWVTDAAGELRRELSVALDRRATNPRWLKDSRRIIFIAGDAGSTFLYSADPTTGESKRVFPQFLKRNDPPELSSSISRGRIQVTGYSVFGDSNGAAAVIVTSYPTYPADIEASGLGASSITLVRSLTGHNAPFERDHEFAEPEELEFKSFDGTSIQGWLIKPLGWREDRKYPMILSIHGGPHGMYGYAFNPTFQVYAARGYAVLYLNPRGSSGYGQKFSDGTINEWGGGDYRDLMAGVDEALRRYSWIDGNRLGVTGGSYGGFMTNWIITQTPRFKAAVSTASVSNLISFYSTSLYQDLIHAEFGGFPWDNYDLLWQWSPLRYVKQAQTPTLFIHGEQDNDVHITQAEEMYMGLRRRGVETVLVRYPREGHGLREPRHRVDALERTLAWFDRFLK